MTVAVLGFFGGFRLEVLFCFDEIEAALCAEAGLFFVLFGATRANHVIWLIISCPSRAEPRLRGEGVGSGGRARDFPKKARRS